MCLRTQCADVDVLMHVKKLAQGKDITLMGTSSKSGAKAQTLKLFRGYLDPNNMIPYVRTYAKYPQVQAEIKNQAWLPMPLHTIIDRCHHHQKIKEMVLLITTNYFHPYSALSNAAPISLRVVIITAILYVPQKKLYTTQWSYPCL